jgi:2-methylaconitate cis-trans-isomerase PrpF
LKVTSSSEQTAIPCTLLRGGTSKAVFFHERDLRRAGRCATKVLKRVMGTPDVVQIDGLGGSRLITSKNRDHPALVAAGRGCRLHLRQVEADRDSIHWDGNCGNISSGVGPFAINAGLVEAVPPVTVVRIHNTTPTSF